VIEYSIQLYVYQTAENRLLLVDGKTLSIGCTGLSFFEEDISIGPIVFTKFELIGTLSESALDT